MQGSTGEISKMSYKGGGELFVDVDSVSICEQDLKIHPWLQ